MQSVDHYDDQKNPKSSKVTRYYKSAEYESFARLLEVGDLVELSSDLLPFRHWAVCVCVDPPTIIHKVMFRSLQGSTNQQQQPQPILSHAIESDLRYVLLRCALLNWKIRVNNSYDEQVRPFSAHLVVAEAKRRLKKGSKYNILSSNCEHFAKQCRNGHKHCGQFAMKLCWRMMLPPFALIRALARKMNTKQSI